MRTPLLLTASAIALLTGFNTVNFEAFAAAPPPRVAYGTFGINTAQMDLSIRPGEDFYRYVNGKWLATTTIPSDKSLYGSFDILQDKSEADLHALLEDLALTSQVDPTLKKVADLYAAWMDKATIEKRGIDPLKPDLDRIAAVKTQTDLMKLVGDINMHSPIGIGIQPDPADTTRYKVFIGQAGLGMGRDYYTRKGLEYDAYRKAYKDYIGVTLELIGDADARESAETIFDLEMKLAQVHWAPARQRDVKATYNPMNRDQLKQLAPNVDWEVVLESAGLRDIQQFVVAETTAITQGTALLDSVALDTWKKYFIFHRVSDTSSLLPHTFDEASFNFKSKTMRGIEQQRERWRRGVTLVDRNIGEGLGQAYVEKYFPPENKERMNELVGNLLAALKIRIEKLDWMDDKTRTEALKKLATFEPRIGYPTKWRDYSTLTIEPGKLFESVQNTHEFAWNRQISHLDEPVDREEWLMTPSTVNAYYNPLMNQITFPAAILQPPFFDALADPAVNYGAIGAVIGHEIGHGFDDQGRQFDEKGRIRNWWTPQTAKKFKAATTALGAQYSGYCPIPDDDKTCINVDLTMGENIGDLGGLQIAYTAYRLSLNGKKAPVIEGFSGDQRFFMAWSQVWRSLSRVDALRNQILTNPHSPAMARGQYPQRNMDSWYEAFGVKEGDKMYLPPQKRVRIW